MFMPLSNNKSNCVQYEVISVKQETKLTIFKINVYCVLQIMFKLFCINRISIVKNIYALV
jgi:hypothetical protein